jgi:hypothetical protein
MKYNKDKQDMIKFECNPKQLDKNLIIKRNDNNNTMKCIGNNIELKIDKEFSEVK